MKNIPSPYMESLLCFVGVFLENIFKNFKTALNIYEKNLYLERVFYKNYLNIFSSTIIINRKINYSLQYMES